MVSTMDLEYPGLPWTLLNHGFLCFEQSILAQAFVLLMGLSREWLLFLTLLKHETLQKPLSAFTGIKVGLVDCVIL